MCHVRQAPSLQERRAFTLVEVVIAVALIAVAFAGLYGTVQQANRLASAAEEDALAESALEQRMDQLRLLEWPNLTSPTGITAGIYTARPMAVSGMNITQETLAISSVDTPAAQTLSATWSGTSAPTASYGAGTALISANALKVVATLSWIDRRSAKTQTRSLVSVISRAGISKSDRP